jgi:hypothetical protein
MAKAAQKTWAPSIVGRGCNDDIVQDDMKQDAMKVCVLVGSPPSNPYNPYNPLFAFGGGGGSLPRHDEHYPPTPAGRRDRAERSGEGGVEPRYRWEEGDGLLGDMQEFVEGGGEGMLSV